MQQISTNSSGKLKVAQAVFTHKPVALQTFFVAKEEKQVNQGFT